MYINANRPKFLITIVTLAVLSLAYIITATISEHKTPMLTMAAPHTQVAQVSGSSCTTGDLTCGLVGWWKFDDGSGTTAADSSGNGNTGTLVNGPTWIMGQVGQALSFNGVNTWVSVNQSTSLQFGTGSFSASAWIYPTSNTQGTTHIVDNRWSTPYWDVIFSGTGQYIQCSISDTVPNSAYVLLPNNTVTINKWHFVACIVDRSTQQMSVYVDGTKYTSGYPDTSLVGNLNNGTNLVEIGQSQTVPSGYFTGIIDDVRVYNRALSANEIATLYNEGLSGGGTPSQNSTYNLTISKSGTGSGTVTSGYINCGSTCAQSNITSGTQITLTAKPDSNSTFSGWSGGSCSGTGVCAVTVTANTTVTATFSQNQTVSSGGVTYYIDYANGSDSNSGTSPSQPWKHSPGDPNATSNPQSVTLKPGDTIAFKGGVVYQFPSSGGYIAALASGSAGSPITYISGNLLPTPWPDSSSRAVIDGTNSSANDTNANDGIISLGGYSWLVVNGFEIRNSPPFVDANQMAYTAGIAWAGQTAGSGNITIEDNYIHDLTMDGVYILGKWALAPADQVPTNFDIRGNTILRTNGHGLLQRWGVNNVVIENNTFDLNGTDIYHTGNSDIMADNMFLEGDGSSQTGGSIQYNTIIRNNIFKKSDILFGYDPTKSNILISDQHNLNIYGNLFAGQPMVANIDAPGPLQEVNIFNNIFTGSTYTFEGPFSIHTIDTVFDSGINIFNNTFVASPAKGADVGLTAVGKVSDVTILNNVIDGNPESGNFAKFGYQVNVNFSTGVVDYSTLQINNNVYNSAMTTPFSVNGLYYKLSGWRSVLQGLGVSGYDANSTYGAVSFVNRSGGDFHLSAGDTLARGQGVNLTSYCSSIPALCTDKDGTPRPSTGPWDIGAYQYSSVGSSLPPSTIPTPSTSPSSSLLISSISSSDINPTTTYVSWTTDTPSTSQVEYGLTTAYGSNTALDASLTTTHSVTLSNLSPNTVYHYAVISKDSSGNAATSNDYTFTTAAQSSQGQGNSASSPAPAVVSNTPPASGGGGSVSSGGGGGGGGGSVSVSIPPPAISSQASVPRQSSADTGSGGGGALTPQSNQPVSVFLSHLPLFGERGNDVKTLQEFLISQGMMPPGLNTGYFGNLTAEGLKKFQGAQNITDNPSTLVKINEIYASNQKSVSVKAGYAQPVAPASSSYGLSSSQISAILSLLQSFNADQSIIDNVRASLVKNLNSASGQSSADNRNTLSVSGAYRFTRTLVMGTVSQDVRELQKFLNNHGFIVSETGYGSPGREVLTFGPATRLALIKFQIANKIIPASGYFGPITMKAVNNYGN